MPADQGGLMQLSERTTTGKALGSRCLFRGDRLRLLTVEKRSCAVDRFVSITGSRSTL